jgi:hypothetical protein
VGRKFELGYALTICALDRDTGGQRSTFDQQATAWTLIDVYTHFASGRLPLTGVKISNVNADIPHRTENGQARAL